jgi:hypothetical protein
VNLLGVLSSGSVYGTQLKGVTTAAVIARVPAAVTANRWQAAGWAAVTGRQLWDGSYGKPRRSESEEM